VSPVPNTHPVTSPGGADPEAELRELQRLALDVAANRGELVSRVDRFLPVQEARLRKEGSRPSRILFVRANDLVPVALRRLGLTALHRRDYPEAERILTDAAVALHRSTARLRRLALTVPSLQWEADASERLRWTLRWEIGKAQSGREDWVRARETLTEVLKNVSLDGRYKPVRKDLEAVEAHTLKATLRGEGKKVRAALQGTRPKARRARKPQLTPEGAVSLGLPASRRRAR
jgi:hypothetical protein